MVDFYWKCLHNYQFLNSQLRLYVAWSHSLHVTLHFSLLGDSTEKNHLCSMEWMRDNSFLFHIEPSFAWLWYFPTLMNQQQQRLHLYILPSFWPKLSFWSSMYSFTYQNVGKYATASTGCVIFVYIRCLGFIIKLGPCKAPAWHWRVIAPCSVSQSRGFCRTIIQLCGLIRLIQLDD